MDCITIDFETFFSADYSLSKMTTEAYIRDPRFEVILVGVKINDTPAFWLLPDRFDQFVRHEVDWKNTVLTCHHSSFDGAILSWHYGVRPAMHIDTLSMARVLDGPKAGNSLYDLCIRHGIGMKGDYVTFAKGKHAADFTAAETHQYGQYCVNDCERTYDLAQIFLEQMPADELKLIDLTIRMFTEPKLLGNEAKLRGAVLTEQKRKRDLLTELGYSCKVCNGSGQVPDVVGNPAPCKACAGAGIDKKPFNSSDKFAEILRAIGVEPKTKPSPSTGEPIYAFARTDAAMQEMLESPDEVVAALAEARVSIKSGIVETRAQRFADMASRGPLAVYLKYGGAHTFRWSGGDACLVADTAVTVFDTQKGAIRKRIIDVLLDDLVWDGEEFVQHTGVKFSGFAEVMSFDGIKGTPDHVVFTDTYGALPLAEAASRGARIMDCPEPAVQGVIPLAEGPEFPPHWGADMKVPVYDIVNCGPRHRFGANGKLVHNCNFQNMSNHNENRPELAVLKQSIYAPDGYRIVCSDSAQGEARLLAWAAGQHDLVEAFAQGRDVYSEHASTVYGRPIDRKRNPADKIPGHVGKVGILSFGFGSGYLKAATEFLKGALGAKPIVFTAADMTALQIDPSPFMNNPKHVHKVTEMPSRLSLNDRLIHCCVTKALVDRYRQRYPAIVAFWGYMDQIIGHMMRGDVVSFGPGGIMTTGKDFILMPNGLKLNYHGIERSDTGEATYFDGRSRTKLYGSLAVENLIQALHRIIVGEQMLEIAKELDVVLMTHDEVTCVVEESAAELALQYMNKVLATPPKWAAGLPLAGDGGIGVTYADC